MLRGFTARNITLTGPMSAISSGAQAPIVKEKSMFRSLILAAVLWPQRHWLQMPERSPCCHL